MTLATLFLTFLAVAGATKKRGCLTVWESNRKKTFEGNIDLTFNYDLENNRAIFTREGLDVVKKKKGDTVYVLKFRWNPGTSTKIYKIQGQTTRGRLAGTFVEKCVQPGATNGGESGTSANGVVDGPGSCQQLDGPVDIYHYLYETW